MVLGRLLPQGATPAHFLPVSGRLYFRRHQLPPGEPFQTTCQLLVGQLRHQAAVGPGPLKAVVAEVEGFGQRFTWVSSAVALTGLHVLELFCARFRHADGFRDLKQRLGWEECQAWTKKPMVRTTQVLLVTRRLLRLLQGRLEAAAGEAWWLHPPWNPGKRRPSVLDVERLLREHRLEIQEGLALWLEETRNAALFLVFLQRLLRSTTGKVFRIVDRLRAHRTPEVSTWVAGHGDRLEVF